MTDKKVKLSLTATGDLKTHEQFEPKNLERLPDMKFEPNPNVYMIYPYKSSEQTTESGIIVDPSQKETKAIIIAKGKNCMGFEAGDVVLIDASTPIYGFWIQGDQYSFIFESTIIGKYTDIKFTHDGVIKA
jgi:hypothetical protein